MMFRETGWPGSGRKASLQTAMVDGFQVSRLDLRLPGLPAPFDGYTILHLSDLHFGPATSREHLRQAVEISCGLKPDVIAMTGDYLQLKRTGIYPTFATQVSPKLFRWQDHRRLTRRRTEELAKILSPLQAPDGCIAVLGNHDYSEGAPTIRRKLGAHILWLLNETTAVEREGVRLLFGGIDDDRYGKPDLDAALDFSRYLEADSQIAAKIFLAHNPDVTTYKAAHRITETDLMLSGHTHGGQVCLPRFGPFVTRTQQKKHVRGLSWLESTPVYVSNGVGYGAVPLRVLCPPELVLIRLVR